MTNADPLAEYKAQDAAEALSDQARVEALLEPYRDSQDASNLYGKMAGEYGAQIKQWLALNPDIELMDQEHGLSAKLKTRKLPGHHYDLVAIIENNPALFARLVSTRALLVNHDAAVAMGLGGELKRYEEPAGETSTLEVKRK